MSNCLVGTYNREEFTEPEQDIFMLKVSAPRVSGTSTDGAKARFASSVDGVPGG